MNSQTVSRDELRAWLAHRIAFYLDRPAANIDPTVELARYGMDSVYTISILSDVEDHLQAEVDLTEARSHRTLDDLTDYLLDLVA